MRKIFLRPARPGQLRTVSRWATFRDTMMGGLAVLLVMGAYAGAARLDEQVPAFEPSNATETAAFERGRQAGREEMRATVGAAYRNGRRAGVQQCDAEVVR